MCTAATYKTKDFYMGRTLDYEFSYGEEITITPRNYEFDFRHAGKLKTHYAIIGMAYVAEHNGIVSADDATEILEKAKKQNSKAAKRILIKGDAEVSAEAAKVFAESNILLLGNESQTVGPENAPMEVHLILLGAGAVLLEGIRLAEVSEGVYFLNAAPLNLSGADGSTCRAILIAAER